MHTLWPEHLDSVEAVVASGVYRNVVEALNQVFPEQWEQETLFVDQNPVGFFMHLSIYGRPTAACVGVYQPGDGREVPGYVCVSVPRVDRPRLGEHYLTTVISVVGTKEEQAIYKYGADVGALESILGLLAILVRFLRRYPRLNLDGGGRGPWNTVEGVRQSNAYLNVVRALDEVFPDQWSEEKLNPDSNPRDFSLLITVCGRRDVVIVTAMETYEPPWSGGRFGRIGVEVRVENGGRLFDGKPYDSVRKAVGTPEEIEAYRWGANESKYDTIVGLMMLLKRYCEEYPRRR